MLSSTQSVKLAKSGTLTKQQAVGRVLQRNSLLAGSYYATATGFSARTIELFSEITDSETHKAKSYILDLKLKATYTPKVPQKTENSKLDRSVSSCRGHRRAPGPHGHVVGL